MGYVFYFAHVGFQWFAKTVRLIGAFL